MRTTGIQVSGVSFLLRRLELALVIGDPRMAHDPLRSQRRAIIVGVLISLLVAGGSVMMALLRPQPSVDGVNLVADENGSLYVRLEGGFHPVSNVASARLVLGRPEEVHKSTAEQLSGEPVGEPIGLPVAPGLAHAPESAWMYCESVSEKETGSDAGGASVGAAGLVGRVVAAPHQTTHRNALLRSDSGLWLIDATGRTLVDPMTARALGVAEIPVSERFLAAFRLNPPVHIPGGESGFPAPFEQAGRVFHTGDRAFLIAPGGVEELKGPRRAYAEAFSPLPIAMVELAEVLALPSLGNDADTPADNPTSGLAGIPQDSEAHWLSADELRLGTLCVSRDGLAEPVGLEPEHEFALQHGGGGYFLGPRGSSPVVTERGMALVGETGMRFAVGGEQDMHALGFQQSPAPVPWAVIDLLPDGGMLSQRNARATSAHTMATATTNDSATGTE